MKTNTPPIRKAAAKVTRTRKNPSATPSRSVTAQGSVSSPALEATTSVRAHVDVGYGNALFIRGEGEGLSWEQGTPLDCVAPSTWVWKTSTVRERLVFKLLLNDQVWAQGNDQALAAGESLEVFPLFNG